jgi:N-acetylglutamate synthase-like GNAT family acetyltransferase
MENIIFKELKSEDINSKLLDNFNRYQEIKRCYRYENGNWIVKNNEFVENWDKNKKDNKIIKFSNILNNDSGYVFGAFENGTLVGYAVLFNKKFGSIGQYIQLFSLQVSFGYRHKGIGKELFKLCIKKTRETGVKKIYISANSSEETIRFYLSIGCKDAIEINKEQAEEEPYDRQMEYEIL